jgi:hypothetical protein
MTFRRTALAQEMARQLLQPSFLDSSLRSGLFLSGERRVGKTTFLATDLIPALEEVGGNRYLRRFVESATGKPRRSGSRALQKFKRVSGVDAGAAGFKFGFKLEAIGKTGGASLAQAFSELIEQAKTNVVLIVSGII